MFGEEFSSQATILFGFTTKSLYTLKENDMMENSSTLHLFFLMLTKEHTDTLFAVAPNEKECSNSTAFRKALLTW